MMGDQMMKSGIVILVVGLFSGIAFAQKNYELKVVNLSIAQEALSGGPGYLQDSAVRKPDSIDFSRPYCYSSSSHFRLDIDQNYKVLKMTPKQLQDGTWGLVLKMETHSSDPIASFRMTCLSKNKTSLEDVKTGLKDVYEVLSTE